MTKRKMPCEGLEHRDSRQERRCRSRKRRRPVWPQAIFREGPGQQGQNHPGPLKPQEGVWVSV